MEFLYNKILLDKDESSNSLRVVEKVIDQDKQKEKRNKNCTIKHDFKYSIAQWQSKKKIDNLLRKLQNKT